SVAAHVDPDVLLVDEVLSVGDYLFQRKCLERMHAVIRSGATVVFVSHNLREVANLCQRSLLLEKGQVQMIGPTEEVIRSYYKKGQQLRSKTAESLHKGAWITQVTIQDEKGPRVEFQSGKKMYVTVEANARERHENMSVVIAIVDNNQYLVFDTCTQRLGASPITLDTDQKLTCTFDLDLMLAQGTFHVHAYL